MTEALADRPFALRSTMLLTGPAVASVIAGCVGCSVSSPWGVASTHTGTRTPVEETEIASAVGTAEAFADGEWLSETFYYRAPDSAVAYELEYPAKWPVRAEEFRLMLSSDGQYEWGPDVAAKIEIDHLWDHKCAGTNIFDLMSATTGGLGEPDSVYEPPPNEPWEQWWSLSYKACHQDQGITALGEVGPTTDPEVAAAYLALVERVAGSLRFVDLPLAEETWEATQVQIDRVELNSPGTQPGRVQYDHWSIAHPASWSVSPPASDGAGWEMFGPLGDLSPGDDMTVRMAPLTVKEWAETESGTEASYLSNFRSAWRLPDEITPDGRRHMRYGIEGSHGKPWMVTADVPDLGEGSEETRQLELLMIHLLLRIDRSQVIEFPEGYPGRP